MDVFIDQQRGGLADQIYRQVRDAIVEGRLTVGARLTPSRELAEELGVSRFTVTEAYGRLAAEGYVDGRRGRGSIVSGSPVPFPPRRDRPHEPPSALHPTDTADRLLLFHESPLATATYDLRPGQLDPALFPTAVWRRCVTATLGTPPGGYGEPAGTERLRNALARWIARSRGVEASADSVVVTSGTTHAIDLVARTILDPGDVVAVEDPGYPPVVSLLRSHRVDICPVPVDEHGIVVGALPARARMVVVTPSHQYPLGGTMSRARRLELLDWAGRAGAAVVEDDYDTELRYTTAPLEPLQRLDRDGRVIYVATFSKTLSPAIRVGFAVLPPALIPATLAIRQAIDWCPPQPTQDALATFLEEGHLDRHLRRVRRVYQDRREVLIDALHRTMGDRAHLLPSTAGLHLTVTVDGGFVPGAGAHLSGRALVSSLRRHYQSHEAQDGLIIGFGYLSRSDIAPAIELLRPLLDA